MVFWCFLNGFLRFLNGFLLMFFCFFLGGLLVFHVVFVLLFLEMFFALSDLECFSCIFSGCLVVL